MTREELRHDCAGLMGWTLSRSGKTWRDYRKEWPHVMSAPSYRPDENPAQALELLIKVVGRNWEISGEEQCVYVFNPAGQLAARQVSYDNTPAGIAFAICKAVCRSQGIDVVEVE